MSQIAFLCDICGQKILIDESDESVVRVISEQTTDDDFFGNLTTYHVESKCKPDELHVNIVVVDGDNRYRGHKYSATKADEISGLSQVGDLRLLLNFGKDLYKVVDLTLRGYSVILCGSGADSEHWANTLQDYFALSPYIMRPWFISKEDFLEEFQLKPLNAFGEFCLIDEKLKKLTKKHMPNIALVELKKNKIHGAKGSSLAKELVSKMLTIPPNQNDALLSLVEHQVKWLKRLLVELKDRLDGSIVETAVCPVGKLEEVVIMKSVLDQLLTEHVLSDLRARMRDEEFELVIMHLYREVPELEMLVHKK